MAAYYYLLQTQYAASLETLVQELNSAPISQLENTDLLLAESGDSSEKPARSASFPCATGVRF